MLVHEPTVLLPCTITTMLKLIIKELSLKIFWYLFLVIMDSFGLTITITSLLIFQRLLHFQIVLPIFGEVRAKSERINNVDRSIFSNHNYCIFRRSKLLQYKKRANYRWVMLKLNEVYLMIYYMNAKCWRPGALEIFLHT